MSRTARTLVFPLAVLALVAAGGLSALVLMTDVVPDVPVVSSDTLSILASLVAMACCVVAARCNPGTGRGSWAMFAVTMGCFAGGDTLWLLFADADGMPPILSFADVLYLVGLLPAVVGLAVYPAARGWRQAWGPMLFDAALLAAAALLACGVLVANEVLAASETTRDALMLLVYPATDVLMVSLVVLVLMRSVGRGRLDLVLLGLTFAVYAVADSEYALTTVRGEDVAALVDLAYVAGPLLLAGAAVHAATHWMPRRQLQRHVAGIVPTLLPDLTALVALGMFVTQYRTLDSTTWVLATGALVLTGLRQLVLTVERGRLRATLEDRIVARTDELAELQDAYQDLETLKFEFVSAVSHELRTPLTAIRGSLEMLADGDVGRLPAGAQPVMEMAVRGSERLARLVDDIIDLDRLARGELSFHPAPQFLSSLLADATTPLQQLAAEREVRLVVGPTDEVVLCDADRIVQALVNLIGNSLKFTPPGGLIEVTVDDTGDEVVIAVADEGRGIPADALEAIFDRFHQVERGDARDHNGAGLGLPITRYIVEANGGRIWVESVLGAGSVFRFTLPRPAPQALDVEVAVAS